MAIGAAAAGAADSRRQAATSATQRDIGGSLPRPER
jgi:hypothetical protein